MRDGCTHIREMPETEQCTRSVLLNVRNSSHDTLIFRRCMKKVSAPAGRGSIVPDPVPSIEEGISVHDPDFTGKESVAVHGPGSGGMEGFSVYNPGSGGKEGFSVYDPGSRINKGSSVHDPGSVGKEAIHHA